MNENGYMKPGLDFVEGFDDSMGFNWKKKTQNSSKMPKGWFVPEG